MRRALDDWRTYIGKIELAMALEDKFGIHISDEELDASESIEALASVICRNQPGSGITMKVVVAEAQSTLTQLLSSSKTAVLPSSSLREVFSGYDRADA